MEQYIIPAVAAVIVAVVEALAVRERRKAKKEKEIAAEHEKAKEELLITLVQSTRAAIALGEATAHAIQRGYPNGDMEAALEYAAKIKHKQKDFLAKQGIHAILE